MRGGMQKRCLWALETFDFLVFNLLGSGAGVLGISTGCLEGKVDVEPVLAVQSRITDGAGHTGRTDMHAHNGRRSDP